MNRDFVQYSKRDCVVCGVSRVASMSIQSRCAAEKLSFQKLIPQWSGFFNEQDNEKAFFTYYRCHQCGLLFCPTFFSEDQLGHMYESMSDNTAGVTQAALRKTQAGYYSFLRRHAPSGGGGYLELGPDIGLFTEFSLREMHFDHYWMVEPNKAVWDILRQKLANHSHDIYIDLIREDKIPEGSLKAANMIHVLDHLMDPVKMLKFLKLKMADDGILLLVTHDESSLLAKILKRRWPAYCLQHPQLFNPDSIRQLVEKAGFKVLEVRKTYNYFPVTWLVRHLCWAFGVRWLKFPEWSRLQLPLKLGNIITVASL